VLIVEGVYETNGVHRRSAIAGVYVLAVIVIVNGEISKNE
jgi:hypothetical protein